MSYPGINDLKLREEIIFERSRTGRKAYSLPKENLENNLPKELLRENLDLPELSEVDVVRHFTRLSTYNYSVDHGFYPLGSCTMKYNPKINEELARISNFANLHPETIEDLAQGTLQMMWETQNMLAEIGGFAKTTLNPSAGAHGEYTGLGIIRTYFKEKGELKRKKIIIPDSAHGTNPASCTLNGFDVIVLKSNEFGKISLNELKEHLSEETAGLMLTIPNTLGVFETDILKITKMVHDAGGLVYGDGANMNALMGKARPGDMGIDVMHFNLHKSFSTPHGGGGPGSGPVAVCEKLVDYLPKPIVEKEGEIYKFITPQKTMGRIRSFYGNIGVVLKAYAYLLELGQENIAKVAENAVLNSNYIKSKL
jgi:glycine dehydrogenase subunit 2